MAHSILIVDDQREVMRLLEKALETLGQRFIITGVLSGEEALLEARLNQVDLLLTDIRLPGMSGLELFTRIRVLRPQVKTFLMTGLTDEETHQKAASAGADAFFTKPVNLAEFLDAVVRVLGLNLEGPLPDLSPEAIESREPEPENEPINLSDRLTGLRLDLPAEAVLLVAPDGQVLVRAGYLENAELEPRLLSSLNAVLLSIAQISRLMKSRHSDSLHQFPGENLGLIAAPLGGGYGLVAAIRNTVLKDSGPAVLDAVQKAAADITEILPQIGIPVYQSESAETPPFVTDIEVGEDGIAAPPDEELANLFEEVHENEIRKLADRFWDQDDAPTGPGSLSPDSLSYEQAVKLGLAPGEGG